MAELARTDGAIAAVLEEAQQIGLDLERMRKPKRAVALAGGPRKYAAILGALRGRFVNVLITDRFTAERLAGDWTPLPEAAPSEVHS